MDDFAYNINSELLQIVEWNTEPRWARFLDGKKRLVKRGDMMLVARSGGDEFELIELLVLH